MAPCIFKLNNKQATEEYLDEEKLFMKFIKKKLNSH
jgi:hypothetical protein